MAAFPARLRESLGAPVDIASLVVFRIAFGLIMIWEVYRFFAKGWIEAHYREPPFLFPYVGFEWVAPWPGIGLELHFVGLAVLALGIASGTAYRLCATAFAAGFAYVFFLDQARYLNHFYLIALLAALLAVVPAHRAVSVDSALRPALRSAVAPAWSLYLLRAQLAIVYLYAAIAKLNADWLHGWPLRIWFEQRASNSMLGPWLAWPETALAAAYAGLLIDLLVIPALLWKRTRMAAFAVAGSFHLANAYLFEIGVFPAVAIATTTLFLSPSWPRRWWPGRAAASRAGSGPSLALPRWGEIALVAYLLVQIALPLRHWLAPGPVAWNEVGHRYAWRMKLRDKEGRCRFWVEDRARGERWIINPNHHLQPWQVQRLCGEPELLVRFAQHHAGKLQELRPGADVAAGAWSWVSLNGRPPQLLFDPKADLSDVAPSRGAGVRPLAHPTPPLHDSTYGFANWSWPD